MKLNLFLPLAPTLFAWVLLIAPGQCQAYEPRTDKEVQEAVLQELGSPALQLYKRLDGTVSLKKLMAGPDIDTTVANNLYQWLKSTAASMNAKATGAQQGGDPETAVQWLSVSLELTRKALGNSHIAVLNYRNLLAKFQHLAGNPGEAEQQYTVVLEVTLKRFGAQSQEHAMALSNLGKFYSSTGNFEAAERPYSEALSILKASDSKAPEALVTMGYNLAILNDQVGRLLEAERLYKETMASAKELLGPDHVLLATGFNNLGLLYFSLGRYSDAMENYKRSMDIYLKKIGTNTPIVSSLYNNLGLVYATMGQISEAEEMYKKALKIDQQIYGLSHKDLIADLSNLASLYKDTGRTDQAMDYYMKVLELAEANYGKVHPILATAHNNLATVLHLKGNYAKAQEHLERAIAIGEKSLGGDHPSISAWIANLAFVRAAQGDWASSFSLLMTASEGEQSKRDDIFLFLPEGQKVSYMKRSESIVHSLISIAGSGKGITPENVSQAFEVWLRWKGAVLETEQRHLDAISASANPVAKAMFQRLMDIKRRIGALKLAALEDTQNTAEASSALLVLERQKQALEIDLMRSNRNFALEKTAAQATAATIQKNIPPGTIYIDYALVESIDYGKMQPSGQRYYAFVLRGDATGVKLYDLGDVSDINDASVEYLEEVRAPLTFGTLPLEDILSKHASTLYARLIAPLEKDLSGSASLIISPAGNLNLLPFEILEDSLGKMLFEKYIVSYATAGRDLLRYSKLVKQPLTSAVIIAAPDFDAPLPFPPAIGAPRISLGSLFDPLPDTVAEAEAVAQILKQRFSSTVKILTGRQATEAALLSLSAPSVLHIATHGFFQSGRQSASPPKGALAIMSAKEQSEESVGSMHLSGLALASANTSQLKGGDYGIFSAVKALGLNLRGTDLVVLSACDTGTGKVDQGEGVFGLRRAFIMAGAQSIVMSLWSVPSAETTLFMTKFYKALARGVTKAEALNAAKLQLRKTHPNPFFWGAFVLIGNPS